MVSFQSIVADIKEIKIQGAQNVARAAAQAIGIVANEFRDASRKELLFHLNTAKQTLLKTRPTEPGMRNVLNYLVFKLEQEEEVIRKLNERMMYVRKHFDDVNEDIAKIGAKKVVNKSIVFTHCHSSAVVRILLKAKKERKRFQVYNTETRPLFQGRLTARELARAGIPVVHFIDSAGRIALKEADIMLIGADAISSEGKVINKIGSEMFAEIADKYDVPVYVCTDSWKFDPLSVFGYEEEIEQRTGKEVWPAAPKGVIVDNKAFENIDSNLITGIISELGVYKPEVFVQEVRRNYPWMF
ncbi:hypothetical protein KY332_02355 [Candidatus Woesearchaeota archaeon]|nr:hypothetical protein [Candidatus Woesearchaeota archaeon]